MSAFQLLSLGSKISLFYVKINILLKKKKNKDNLKITVHYK